MDFWTTYDGDPPGMFEATPVAGRAPAGAARSETSAQNDLTGVCEWCGQAGDDVLLGICADCAEPTEGT